MLRHSASSFSFHLIPSPAPPYLPPRPHVGSTNSRGRSRTPKDLHALYEGCGTLVSVHKESPGDRTLIIEVRPPSAVTGAVMREFAKPRREWWMLPSEVYTGDAGQANLLQSQVSSIGWKRLREQVYDACVQNQVFFFVVTNLKYWVFGQFVRMTWLMLADRYRIRHIQPQPSHRYLTGRQGSRQSYSA